MSFQSYLDTIKAKTGKTPEDFKVARVWNAMVTHCAQITDPAQIDTEVLDWLEQAYAAAPYPSHAPANFDCVFCRIVREAVPALAARHPSDVVYQSECCTAFLAIHRWQSIPLTVLVVPNEHYENLYTLPVRYAEPLHSLTRSVALALKGLYNCDGISTRQHNEPAGNQDVWHYHVHVTPRYHQDDLYRSSKIAFPEEERLAEAARLRDFIAAHQAELFEP